MGPYVTSTAHMRQFYELLVDIPNSTNSNARGYKLRKHLSIDFSDTEIRLREELHKTYIVFLNQIK